MTRRTDGGAIERKLLGIKRPLGARDALAYEGGSQTGTTGGDRRDLAGC